MEPTKIENRIKLMMMWIQVMAFSMLFYLILGVCVDPGKNGLQVGVGAALLGGFYFLWKYGGNSLQKCARLLWACVLLTVSSLSIGVKQTALERLQQNPSQSVLW